MGGGPLWGSEECGMIMGEEEKNSVYCHRVTGQRGADEGVGHRERARTRFGGEFGLAEAALCKTSNCYHS